ncbi:EAL domain-containing protein [Caldimonas tepidiphila]|uniref:EAL domain-containing protein n=1 Tax=Caldimonas tepidiphila TaxID=2315841 RepID=UPI000E5C2387|nr:EAL domain-containing protein [Caldimonas tepidiphila]
MSQTTFPVQSRGGSPEGATRPCGGDCADAAKLGFGFAFAYQPIVDIASRSVYAHEALVRGTNGEPAPTVLSQVNEANRYRFDQACRVKAIRQASDLGLDGRLSINFLPNAVYRPEVCIRTTLEAARAYGFPVENIVFETTEGERVEDAAWYAEVMREYKRIGFKTAIDDFGAGYAGLALLADFVPDIVKLDMELIRGVEASRPRQAIVRATAGLCRELGIVLIAEGVESAGERDFLADAGIHLMQGYFFARPAFSALTSAEEIFGPQR